MNNEDKNVFSPDYYEVLTNPESNIIVNDIRFINNVLLTIDSKYEEYKSSLKRGIVNEQTFRGLDPQIGSQLYDELIEMMEEKKENLKKDIIVSGHLANISNKTNIRTAVVFYNNLKSSVSQQLDIAYSLIVSRLRNFYLRDTNNDQN
jgi:hypothetical protein